MDFSVVIPARNEAQRLPPTLDRILEYLPSMGRNWEVIVVDNNSTDKTAQIVEEYAQKYPNLRLMYEPQPGKGAALRTGMLAARGNIVLFSDADLSCPIEEEQKLRAALEQGNDVAIASRRLRESEVDKSLKRKLMSALFNWMVQLLALPGIKDSQCGFKAFWRDAACQLFSASRVDGWAFDVEILFLARKASYKIAEVPVRWAEGEGSKVDAVKDSFRMMRDIIKFRLSWLRGAYQNNKQTLNSKP